MNSAEILNQAIEAFQKERTEANVSRVILQLMKMTRGGEQVLTPMKFQPRLYLNQPQAESLYKVITAEGMQLHVCYVTPGDAVAAQERGSLSRIRWEEMLRAVVSQPAVSGLAVNPGSRDFVVSKQLCQAILQQLKLL